MYWKGVVIVIYGYENHNINIEQVGDRDKNREYNGLKIDEIISQNLEEDSEKNY